MHKVMYKQILPMAPCLEDILFVEWFKLLKYFSTTFFQHNLLQEAKAFARGWVDKASAYLIIRIFKNLGFDFQPHEHVFSKIISPKFSFQTS